MITFRSSVQTSDTKPFILNNTKLVGHAVIVLKSSSSQSLMKLPSVVCSATLSTVSTSPALCSPPPYSTSLQGLFCAVHHLIDRLYKACFMQFITLLTVSTRACLCRTGRSLYQALAFGYEAIQGGVHDAQGGCAAPLPRHNGSQGSEVPIWDEGCAAVLCFPQSRVHCLQTCASQRSASQSHLRVIQSSEHPL